MAVTFGLAVENFTPMSKEPTLNSLIAYATRAEDVGLSSLWVWDHLFLGARRAFPFFEALTTLTVLAAHTQTMTLGTGVLVLPIRDPVLLAKVTGTIQAVSGGRLSLGVAAGWYEREFEATGVPFKGRGKVFERNLEVLFRLWEEDTVTGDYDHLQLRSVRMLPHPTPRPQVLIGGYVDRVLRRVATTGDGWLTYFYTADSFGRAWQRIRDFAEEAGRNPDELRNVAQLPFCVASSFEEADKKVRHFIHEYFDVAEWSESSPDSAIRGTPEQCAEQLAEHIAVGSEHIVLVPYGYELEQVERLATEVLPKVGYRGSEIRS
ncbi:MAG: LLM class flavin-dependent oxidoreductase [Acidimicrobiales bacterium]